MNNLLIVNLSYKYIVYSFQYINIKYMGTRLERIHICIFNLI